MGLIGFESLGWRAEAARRFRPRRKRLGASAGHTPRAPGEPGAHGVQTAVSGSEAHPQTRSLAGARTSPGDPEHLYPESLT